MTAEATVNQLITGSQAAAATLQAEAIALARTAQTAASGALTLATVPSPTEPNILIPPFVDPDQDLSNEYRTEIANAFSDLDPKLTADISDFLDEWFPDFAGCLKTQVDGWICDTIENGATGIPAAVENAIWQRSRERELRDAVRLEAEVSQEWAGRGFMLPPGALVVQLDQLRQEAANKVSTHSRDVAIKQAEIQIETIKFAVEQGIRLRLGIVAAIIDFFRAKLGMHSLVKERAMAYVDAKRALWQGAAAYYQALIAAEELHLKYDQIRIEAVTQSNAQFVEAVSRRNESEVHAAVAAADALGDIAAAAYGSLNTLAAIENSTIQSEG